jgi:uncharacterized delta-60 repeat protein
MMAYRRRNLKTLVPIAIAAFGAFATPSVAQDGVLDPSFGPAALPGRVTHAFNLPQGTRRDSARAVFVRGNRYLVVGRADTTPEGKVQIGILTLDRAGGVVSARVVPTELNVDSALDRNGIGLGFGIDASGRLYVSGRFDPPTFTPVSFAVTRLSPTLEIDTSYGNRGLALVDVQLSPAAPGGQSFALHVGDDGAALIVGSGVRADSTGAMLVARLRPDGSPDPAFGDDGLVEVSYDVVLQPSALGNRVIVDAQGRVVVGGVALSGVGAQSLALARLSANGTLDATFCPSAVECNSAILQGRRFLSFGGTSGASEVIFAMRPLPDGGFLVAGDVPVSAGPFSGDRCAIAKLRADGGLDLSFADAGLRHVALGNADCHVRDLLVDRHGRIVVVGNETSFEGGVRHSQMFAVALRTNGEFDREFALDADGAPSAIVRIPFAAAGEDDAEAIAAAFDGERILIAGEVRVAGAPFEPVDDTDFAVLRLKGGAVFVDSFENTRTVD